jgi:hypothetical protein
MSDSKVEKKFTALSNLTDFVKKHHHYVRLAKPTTQKLGEFEVVIQDSSFLPRADERAMDRDSVWRGQPRAKSVITVSQNGKVIHEHILSGFLKFSYAEKPKYVRGDFKPYRLVATSKENGEYMPVSYFTIQDQGFWVIGSKNVRVVVRRGHELDDLKYYSASKADGKEEEDDAEEESNGIRTDRFSFACYMASHFFTAYSTKLDAIASYLDMTGMTMNCESCRQTSQHLTRYDSDCVYVFSFTKTITDTDPAITALLPEEMVASAEKLGLPHVTLKTALLEDSKAVDAMLDGITREKNSEGSVIYVIGRNSTNTEAVIWAYKYKAEEYVFWRAVREIMRNNSNSIRKTTIAIDKLLDRFSSGEQKLVTLDLAAFIKDAHAFHAYWRLVVREKEFFAQWPTHMNIFSTLEADAKNKLTQSLAVEVAKEVDSLVFIIKGPPGSGKSTFGKVLTMLLTQSGVSCEYLDQDMVGGDPRNYAAGIKKRLENGVKMLVLGKSHHNKKTRADLYKVLPDDLTRIFIDFYHPVGNDEWKKLVLDRINKRGEHHQNLTASKDLPNILTGFFNSMETLTDAEKKTGTVIQLDVTDKVDNWITRTALAISESKLYSFNPSSSAISNAIKTVLSDELKIVCLKPQEKKDEKKAKKVMYYAVTFTDTSKLLTHELVTKKLDDHKIKPQAKHHVTLKFFGGKGTPEEEKPFQELVGKEVKVVCLGVAGDNKGVAVKVKLPDGITCANKHAHITIGVASGTQPVYSNTLLDNVAITPFNSEIILDGEVVAV